MFCLAWGALVCDRVPKIGHNSWWPQQLCVGHVPRHVVVGCQWEQRQQHGAGGGRGAPCARVLLAWLAEALSRQLELAREAQCRNQLSWLLSA